MLKNNKGILTLSFLLVLVIIFFFFLAFFSLVMTFAHVSVSQYMSYSAARRLSLAGEDKQRQKEQAKEQYEKLRAWFFEPSAHAGNPGDWFNIPQTIDVGSSLGFVPPGTFPGEGGTDRNMFYGASFVFTSYITKFQIPSLMEKGNFSSINANIRSFLGREPSKDECQNNFNKERGNKIRDKYSSVPNFGAFVPYFNVNVVNEVEDDNGC